LSRRINPAKDNFFPSDVSDQLWKFCCFGVELE
jgi:hypothetical protein